MNYEYSILIPCYNGLQFLPNIFKQINNQTLKPIELIFINDGDSSITKDIVSNYNTLNFNLKYIKNDKNIGVNKSIKKACKFIKTKFIKIMSVDDIFDENYAKTHLDMLNKHPEAGMSFSNPSFFILEENKYYQYDINLSPNEVFFNHINFKRIAKERTFKIFSNTPIYNSEIFKKYNYFDDFYGRDADQLTNFIISSKYGVCFIPKIQSYWTMHSKQISKFLYKNYNTLNILENIYSKNKEDYNILVDINYFYDTSIYQLIRIIFSKHLKIIRFNFIIKFLKFKIWKIFRLFVPKKILEYLVKRFS
tara:strand:- start:19 stop:939 length:921 start_codon:yes stop_codon:yes gene_type:complete